MKLTPIDYPQLYAQLEYEVSTQRLRYHLTREEEHALMQHNLRFQKLSQLGEQLLSLFEQVRERQKILRNGILGKRAISLCTTLHIVKKTM